MVSISDTGPITVGDLSAELPAIADHWAATVRDRTTSGRDADGSSLRPLADGSACRLTHTGRLVASFGVTSMRADGFTLAPRSSRDRTVGYVHQNTGRSWVGIDPQTVETTRRHLAEAVLPRD